MLGVFGSLVVLIIVDVLIGYGKRGENLSGKHRRRQFAVRRIRHLQPPVGEPYRQQAGDI